MVNAGITDVGVVLHGQYQSLLDHLGTGKDWDLSRKRGGLTLLPPFAYESRNIRGVLPGQDGGTGRRPLLPAGDPPGLCALMATAIWSSTCPFGDVLSSTSTPAPTSPWSDGNGSFQTRERHLFRAGQRGPDHRCALPSPHSQRAIAAWMSIFSPRKLLLELVDECTSHDQYSFRRDVLQARKDTPPSAQLRVGRLCRPDRYVQEYYDRSMQLLDPAIRAELFCPQRPIRAKGTTSAPPTIWIPTAGASTPSWPTAATLRARWRTPSSSPACRWKGRRGTQLRAL